VTPAQIQELEKLYQELVQTARSEDAKQFIQADLAIHEMIWRSQAMSVGGSSPACCSADFRVHVIRLVTGRSFDLLQDARSHRPMLDALASKNPEATRKAFTAARVEWLAKTTAYVLADSARTQTWCDPFLCGGSPSAELRIRE
jgi:DNA-binding GntR family transcriptional regulator